MSQRHFFISFSSFLYETRFPTMGSRGAASPPHSSFRQFSKLILPGNLPGPVKGCVDPRGLHLISWLLNRGPSWQPWSGAPGTWVPSAPDSTSLQQLKNANNLRSSAKLLSRMEWPELFHLLLQPRLVALGKKVGILRCWKRFIRPGPSRGFSLRPGSEPEADDTCPGDRGAGLPHQ